MRILLLGGPVFLGRAVVETALARGHDVTMMNRGRSAPDPAGVRVVRGDRTRAQDLRRVAGQAYDAVVDTCGFVPRDVLASARALVGCASSYVYVSSVSAYAGWPGEPVGPDAVLRECPPDAGPDAGGYGELKAGCERAVQEVFADRALVLRAGLLTGPHDNVGRLPWWLHRTARGGDVLAPGDPDTPVQMVDARDVAAFALDLVERGSRDVACAVSGPRGQATWGRFLGTCASVTGAGARLRWVDDDTLLAAGVEPWTELPLWAPAGAGLAHVWDADTSRARALGLRCRPLERSVGDAWAAIVAGDQPRAARSGLPPVGMEPAKEADLLARAAAPGGPDR